MRSLAILLATLTAGTAFAQVPPTPRLSGIVVTPESRAAIFTLDQDGVSLIASVGETIGPWTIVGITAHDVEVATESGRAIVVPGAREPAPADRPPPTGEAMFNLP